jgi:hypothetical protein
MKTTLLKQLSLLGLILITCNVFALRKEDTPPTCNLRVDYSAAVTQPGSSAKALALNGVLRFDVNKITTNAEFDDFVNKTTIVVKHAGVLGTPKSLKDYLKEADSTYLTSQRDSSVKHSGITGYKVLLTRLTPQVGDTVIITCKVKAGLLTKAVQLAVTKEAAAIAKVKKEKTQPNLTVDAALKKYLENEGGDESIDGVSLNHIRTGGNSYDKENNKAYLVVDQNGELIDNYPVNIDQDDIVYVIIVGRKDKIEGYTADYTGTYAPVDLQMRNFTPIDTAGFGQNGAASYNPDDYTVIVKKRGPFTSANVIVKIKDNADNGTILATYTLTVNTLFHLGFGVAFNRTSLENPDYIVSPLNGTQNTIVKTNDGNRNLVSVNVIWYWSSTFKYITRGDNITRGRDVLKEPNFLERINPTFGVGLSGKMTDNMFAGLTFEFARGGSIFGGYHFGMVKRLVDPTPGFNIGKDVFTGTAADIKTSNVSNKDWAFGIVLDTRIFNALFKRGS